MVSERGGGRADVLLGVMGRMYFTSVVQSDPCGRRQGRTHYAHVCPFPPPRRVQMPPIKAAAFQEPFRSPHWDLLPCPSAHQRH